MPEDYYPNPGSDDEASPSTTGEEPAKPAGEKEEGMEGETALLPKSILAGKEFNPGDELVLKIVHLYDDEVEVAYAKEPAKETLEEPADMEAAKGQLDMMAT